MLKAGYNVVVTSWENDADNYGTQVVHVAGLADAKFLKEFALLFTSRNSHKQPRGFGNVYGSLEDDEEERLLEAVNEILKNNPDTIYKDWFQPGPVNLDSVTDLAGELLGHSSDDFLFRVCESVEVLYLDRDPEEIEV